MRATRHLVVFSIAVAASVIPIGSPGPVQGFGAAGGGGEYCCAFDQNVSAFFSDEIALMGVEWGWPEGDPRELAACGVLGGSSVLPTGRVDTTGPNGFDTALEPCRRGRSTFYNRIFAPYAQVRFVCNSRYQCGGAEFILSGPVKTTRGGLPPPAPACRVPRVTGLRLAAARVQIRRAMCRVGTIRRVRSSRQGRVLAQRPSAGALRSLRFPVRLVVGRR